MKPEIHSTDSATRRGALEERERVRQILHGGLGQLLTSISFLAGSLQQRLQKQGLPEAAEAGEIAALTMRAINETRGLVPEATEFIPIEESIERPD